MKFIKGSIIACILLICCTGCSKFEKTSFQTLSASQAVVDTAQADYIQGTKIKQTPQSYAVINKAKQVQDTAVDGLLAYHDLSVAAVKNPSAIANAQGVVVAALAELPQVIIDVKALYNSAPPVQPEVQ